MDDADKGMGAGFKPVRHRVRKRTGSVLMIFCHLHKISDRLRTNQKGYHHQVHHNTLTNQKEVFSLGVRHHTYNQCLS